MKRNIYLILTIAAVGICFTFLRPLRAQTSSDVNAKAQQINEQSQRLLNDQEERGKRTEALLVGQEELLKRYQRILAGQEEVQARYQKIVETWERQQKEYQRYLDTLPKK